MSDWAMGRASRRPTARDPLLVLQLVPMADAARAVALGEPARDISERCGLAPEHVAILSECLIRPQAWSHARLPAAGRHLPAADLIQLESMFDRVHRAMTRATKTRQRIISRFSMELNGPRPPRIHFSADAVAGARALFAAARLGKNRIGVARAGREHLITLSDETATGPVQAHWLEAVSLALVKARMSARLKQKGCAQGS